jgi:HEAT repeat protein
MSIHIVCRNCGTGYNVSDDLLGKKVLCRNCDESIPVRAASGVKRNEPPHRKSAAPPRRREDEDEDEDEARPRKRKARATAGSDHKVLLLGGGLLALLLLVGGVIAVFALIPGKEKAVAVTQPAPQPPAPQPPAPQPPAPQPPAPQPAPQPGGTQDTAAEGRSSAQKVYERVCQSTVLILVAAKIGNELAVKQGSGTLIDKTNRLVLTNDHVVSGGDAIAVFFQAFANGKRIAELKFFLEQFKQRKAEVPKGEVVFTDKRVDLALVQLNRLPPDAQALPLADKSPAVTNPVLSVGHPKGIAGGGLWVHTSGEVRQFQQGRQWRAGDEKQVSDHEADVILTNSQTNQGDSGGPLVNMRAQLVGVTQGGLRDANALSFFIDLPEVRKLLKRYEDKSRVKLVLETQSGVGGDVSSLPKLLADLGSPKAQVRSRAALALGELGPDAQTAIPALVKALKDSDETVARQAGRSLRAIGAPTRDDLPLLIEGIRDANPRVRNYAVEALGKMGAEARSAVPALAQVLKAKETDTELRQQAARTLGQIGPAATAQGVPALSEALKSPEAVVREAAAETLGKFGGQAKAAVPALLATLEDNETTVRRAVLAALAQIGPGAQETLPKLRPAFKDPDSQVRCHALDVLGRLGAEAGKDKEAMAALKAALDDQDLCKNALIALARIGPPAKELAKGLAKHLRDEKHRLEAVAALGSLLEKVKPAPKDARDLRPVLDELINLFEVQDPDLHTKAIEALGKIGSAAVTPLFQALQKAAQNDRPSTRYGVVRALGAIGRDARRRDVILALKQLSSVERKATIRDACDKALQRIQ